MRKTESSDFSAFTDWSVRLSERGLPNEEDKDNRSNYQYDEKNSDVLHERWTSLTLKARIPRVARSALSTELASVTLVTAPLRVKRISERTKTGGRIKARDENERELVSSPITRSWSPFSSSMANGIRWAILAEGN